jgi:hypothetical protein
LHSLSLHLPICINTTEKLGLEVHVIKVIDDFIPVGLHGDQNGLINKKFSVLKIRCKIFSILAKTHLDLGVLDFLQRFVTRDVEKKRCEMAWPTRIQSGISLQCKGLPHDVIKCLKKEKEEKNFNWKTRNSQGV